MLWSYICKLCHSKAIFKKLSFSFTIPYQPSPIPFPSHKITVHSFMCKLPDLFLCVFIHTCVFIHICSFIHIYSYRYSYFHVYMYDVYIHLEYFSQS